MVIVLLKKSSAFAFKIKQMRALHSFEMPVITNIHSVTSQKNKIILRTPEYPFFFILIFTSFEFPCISCILSPFTFVSLYLPYLCFFSLRLGAECDHFAPDPFLLSFTFKLWHTYFYVTHRTDVYLAFVIIRTCIRKQRLGKFVFVLKNKRQRATLVQTQSASESRNTCSYTQREIQCIARKSIWAPVNQLISKSDMLPRFNEIKSTA
jgi:hypothetical protein